MRILTAFVCMGFLGTVAAALTLVQVLTRVWPMLLVALGVVVVVRLHGRRRRAQSSPPAMEMSSRTPAPRLPMPAGQPSATGPSGWVLVPVWMAADGQPQRHPVIDGDVITGDCRDG
jgi:hypothetical protein